MFGEKNLTLYVLLEKSPTSAKAVGIFTHAEALKKKEELMTKLTFKTVGIYSYHIQGPFDVNVDKKNEIGIINPVINPPILPIIESPRLFKRRNHVKPSLFSNDFELKDIDDDDIIH